MVRICSCALFTSVTHLPFAMVCHSNYRIPFQFSPTSRFWHSLWHTLAYLYSENVSFMNSGKDRMALFNPIRLGSSCWHRLYPRQLSGIFQRFACFMMDPMKRISMCCTRRVSPFHFYRNMLKTFPNVICLIAPEKGSGIAHYSNTLSD